MRIAANVLWLPALVIKKNVVFENEILECSSSDGCFSVDLPPNNPNDSSFENPQDQWFVPGDSISCPNLYSVLNSQAILGYLNSPDDFDVYNYNITLDDYVQAQAMGPPFSIPSQPAVLVGFAFVIPQACENNKDAYFSLALIANPYQICTQEGPLPPTDYSTLTQALASALPPNKTVIVVADGGNRSIYDPPALQGVLPDLEWYLPGGCQVSFLPDGGESINCTKDAAYISAYVCNEDWLNETAEQVEPVEIQFAVFGNGAYDYTLNIGISEDCIAYNMSLWGLRADNQHLVNGCSEETNATAPPTGAPTVDDTSGTDSETWFDVSFALGVSLLVVLAL
jgi:hypothetical protein